ncbi:hypothetical protein [Pasteurella multocida]|uniref:hypothetical protein n=1 Tax=Pasteurella multocida TaxID=747 RepID=UPI002C6C085E|nr:hypothetical protein [Pasteurella multocida]MEB3457158.1 hypothetical protein [Pasteurella multocida]
MNQAIHINLQVEMPYLTVQEYARRANMKEKAVRDLVQAGKLPVMPRNSAKEKIQINMLALARQALMQQ